MTEPYFVKLFEGLGWRHFMEFRHSPPHGNPIVWHESGTDYSIGLLQVNKLEVGFDGYDGRHDFVACIFAFAHGICTGWHKVPTIESWQGNDREMIEFGNKYSAIVLRDQTLVDEYLKQFPEFANHSFESLSETGIANHF